MVELHPGPLPLAIVRIGLAVAAANRPGHPHAEVGDSVAFAGSVRDAIIIGILLAGVVLFVFLRNARIMLVTLIVVPAVIAITALVTTFVLWLVFIELFGIRMPLFPWS